MEDQSRNHGSLIAFEGPENLIATQLRLLPASPQLLILPSLQHYIKDVNTRYSARSYIKIIHEAARARHEDALRFLNKSTGDSKRLVFLNGGTAGAVAQCISAIGEREALGDDDLAETIYKNIANEGVKGLEREEKYSDQKILEIMFNERVDSAIWEDDHEDPITKAMRAADALYKETDSLQPADCYIRTRPRSLSLPMIDITNGSQASPFFVFGASPSEEATSPQSPFGHDESDAATPTGKDDLSGSPTPTQKNVQLGSKLKLFVPPRPASSIVETSQSRNVANRSTFQLLSSTNDSFMSTPEGVVYGEARVVQMAGSKSHKKLRKVRSLDDMELNEARRRRIIFRSDPTTRASPTDSAGAKSRHLSIIDDPYSSDNFLHLSQAKFVKAQKTTIRRSPTFSNNIPKTAKDTNIHHGTNIANFENNDDAPQREFETVLPIHEDLVIHFTSFSLDHTLDSVMQWLREGSYPICSYKADSFHTAETDSCPSTPRTEEMFDRESHAKGLSPVAEVPSSDEASDYDPYAPRGGDVRQVPIMPSSASRPRESVQLPPPAKTSMMHGQTKYHDFSCPGRSNAISTQNSLRRVLESYYPEAEGSGYLQSSSALLSDKRKLWMPVFRASDSHNSKSVQPSADLMLAVGCQKGVKSEFVAALTGQLEKLGSPSCGMSRSGSLDIRYLINTAMSSSSTQPLTAVLTNTLADSPYVLASLLIPHLEVYLATNAATRFLLLSYSSEHIATVLSLQKLIGSDLFKVAGILDASDVAGPPSGLPQSSRNNSIRSYPSITSIERLLDASSPVAPPPAPSAPTAPAEQKQQPQRRPTLAHRRRMSFSRADYILSSTSNEAEIAGLISEIWKILIDIDLFYTPGPNQFYAKTPNRVKSLSARGLPSLPPPPPASLTSKFTDHSTSSTTTLPVSPPLSPPAHSSSSGDDSATSRTTTLAVPSPTSSRSAAGGGRPQQLQQQLQHKPRSPLPGSVRTPPLSPLRGHVFRGDDAISVVDEGEFYDDEERRLMPLYMGKQREMKKMTSRKALKWLGLA